MENQKKAVCLENENLAVYMWNKRQEMAQGPRGISENVDLTLHKAYSNVCNCKTPIKTLKDLSQIKGIGKWVLKQMQGFFETDSGVSENEELNRKGNKNKVSKRYMPQKNSVAYALLITLYRATENGSEFMHKQELIDAAEASGLSRVPIMPEKMKGKAGHFGSSPRDWYTGWSCMKTLITKGLVVKSSCPAKYMLTEEGKEAAHECLLRSGLEGAIKGPEISEKYANLERGDKSNNESLKDVSDNELAVGDFTKKLEFPSVGLKRRGKPVDVPPEYLDKFISMGFSRKQIIRAFSEVLETSKSQDISLLWPTVLCQLREDQVYGLVSAPQRTAEDNSPPALGINRHGEVGCSARLMNITSTFVHDSTKSSALPGAGRGSSTLRACLSSDYAASKQNNQGSDIKSNILAVPPLSFGEKFGDAYEVILILDDREQFAMQGSRSKKIVENISTEFRIKIEVRRLPVGDCIWIARHKCVGTEYVLDFIVERKKVDDLRLSIRDNRYRDQKLRLLRCGLRKMIYLVEGDPNSSEAAESIKTACFTTEILEGFDVQRTSGLADTLRKYGYLTQSINQYYCSQESEQPAICPPFDEFIKRCEDLDKMTVSDVFAVQLMQVPFVTEEVALAVLDMYPTLLSLACAYSLLDGDIRAQEEMLKRQSNNLISGPASRNIFQLIWSS